MPKWLPMAMAGDTRLFELLATVPKLRRWGAELVRIVLLKLQMF